MSDRNPKVNRLLIFITVFLCLLCGFLFTRSSAGPFENTYTSVITGDMEEESSDADHSAADSADSALEVSATASPTPVPASSDEENVSPEAGNGVWTADGSDWKFLVDGAAYTGWLTDTDGHRYYFDENGIMQRGWITVNKKKYYLDEDGILQTGTVTIDGKKYTFSKDGSLKK